MADGSTVLAKFRLDLNSHRCARTAQLPETCRFRFAIVAMIITRLDNANGGEQ